MPLSAGTRIGPYEVLSLLGKGGMGEVYRAADPALGRHVAIKVLPDAVAHDAERVARFEREARTLAALNHPNIGAIYGLERSGDVLALVAAALVAVGGGGPDLGTPVALFSYPAYGLVSQSNSWSYSANADGSKFLVKARPDGVEERVIAVTNWRARLRSAGQR